MCVALVGCGSGTSSKSPGEPAAGSAGVNDAAAGAASQQAAAAAGQGPSEPPIGADSGGEATTAPTATGGMGAGAAFADGGASGDASAGAAGAAPTWTGSDVTPVRTRVGPQTSPQQLFSSDLQLGAYWETPSGDVLTSFRTSITQPQAGIAIYDYHYKLQTIVGASIQPAPDVDVGTCRYQDAPYGSCYVGPDSYGPTLRSLVTDDGKILVVREQPTANSTMHPIVEQLDPATGTLSSFVELSDIQMNASSLAYNSTMELRQLADGSIALSLAMHGDPARTVVFDSAGARLAQRPGFAFGERWQRFALFVGETNGPYNQRFDWWDPRSDEAAFAFGFPPANPAPSFRTFVTPVGDVVFPGYTYTDRVVRIDPDGKVVEDRALPIFGFLGTFPDGRYLAYEAAAGVGYALRIYDRNGVGTTIYDDPRLLEDSKWPPLGNGWAGSGSNFYPIIERLKFSALFDDAGNAYVGFVLETGGDTSETYLVAFAPDGQKRWGFNLKTTYNGVCQPTRVLSGHRLIVSCDGRYQRRLLILGE